MIGPKNVLFVLPNDLLGGAEQKLKQLATLFSNNKCGVNVLFLRKKISDEWSDLRGKANLDFIGLNKVLLGVLALPFKLRGYAKSNLDYTFASYTGINGLLGIFRKLKILKTKKLVVRESTLLLDRFGGLKGSIFRLLYILGYKYTDLVICQTSFMKDRLLYHLPIAKNWNVVVIPNPIDLDEIKAKEHEKVDLPFTNDTKFILGVGRLIPLKGFEILIKAFKTLKIDHHLVIIGGGEKNELNNLVSKLEIGDKVHLLGHKSNPYPYMKCADCCVISSKVEGFPNTLLQMMALNDRVVSTLCAGDIDKLEGVIKAPIDDIEMLSLAIKESLTQPVFQLSKNRALFDEELKNRTLESYLESIVSNL